MKLAILFLVHGSPRGMDRLLSRLSHPDVKFFIHVDGKSSIKPFEDALVGYDNVIFLKGADRVRVNWGGRSVVDAVLSLIGAAQKDQANFDRFLLLSAADYPICTPKNLLEFLERTTVEIMRINWSILQEKDRKIRTINLLDIEWLNPRNTTGIKRKIRSGVQLLVRQLRVRPFPQDIEVVKGSLSFCLTRRAAEEILAYHSNSPEFYNILKYSYAPDEMYVHSILVNSGFKFLQDCRMHHQFPRDLYGMHYIDWYSNPRPKVLGMDDLSRIRDLDGAMFVRKVDPRNESFLDELDKIASERAKNAHSSPIVN